MPEENLVPRIPPHSDEAEQSVLGSVLMDPDAVAAAAENLKPEDFYDPKHKEIFEAVLELYRKGSAVDVVTLKTRLESRGTLETCGGMKYLGQLAIAVPNSVYVKNYIRIVRERALNRRFIKLANNILAESYSTQTPIEELSEKVEQEVFGILQNRGSEDFQHISELLGESFENIENAARNHGTVPGIPTGFADLDAKLAGLHNSDLVLVGARPSMGKTAFGLNIIQNAALRAGKSCAVFSLEMSGAQVATRLLGSEAGVNMEHLRTGEMEDEDWEKLVDALGTLSEAKIYVDDTGGITLSEVRSKCRKLKIEHGLDLVMIDYLQLMSGSGKGNDNRQQEISEISRGLKMLARELNIPVIALSQLSRQLESRSDHRPMMSDLRESGAIEQDADVIMFIYRDEYYHPDSEEKGVAEIIISKQRNGPVGTVKLHYAGQYVRFANLEGQPRYT
ncbi:MAG: replicative DNA helicase [Lachnospiraceae bacterium]|nr:replicative DNA helicase [Lachnospiraceae bacterium]